MNPASSSRPFAGSSDSGKELLAVPEALREDALIPVSA